MALTFALTVFAWIFFRSDNLGSAFLFVKKIFSRSLFSMPTTEHLHASFILPLVVFFIIEWVGREEQYAIAKLEIKWPKPVRYAAYYTLFFYVMYYGSGIPQQFIYFQF